MAELMLINPRRRRRAAPKRKTTARRKPARRRVVAKRNPSPPRRRIVRRRSPARSIVARKRRYKRNPTARGIVDRTIMPAAVAGLGALSLDVIWGFVPLPETIKSGPLRHVAKGAGAIGMGILAENVVGKKTASTLVIGAMTVIMHDAFREVVARFMPAIPLGYYSAGMPAGAMGAYVDGMGAYVGGAAPSPYLSQGNLSQPFAGPSAAQVAFKDGVATGAALETEQNMGHYYS